MQDIINFMQQHWTLSLALLVILFLLIILEFIKQKKNGGQLSPTQMTQLINHENAVIIDVRNSDVFANGHIIDAVSIPLKDINNKNKKIEKYKNQPIVLVCAMGADSQKAAHVLGQSGLRIHVLKGGLRAWQDANLPLVKG